MSAIPSSLASLSFAGTLTSSLTATQGPQPAASNAQTASTSQAASILPRNIAGDFVRLTEAQQVEQQYSHGRTVPQIASNLELSIQAVDNYLSISRS